MKKQAGILERLRPGIRAVIGAVALCLGSVRTYAEANEAKEANHLAAQCDEAVRIAASESGVSISVMRAITRTGTSRAWNGRLEPWSWTVNVEGKGQWFPSLHRARALVFRLFQWGAGSFDVGCFQINHYRHSRAFRSIEELFDPITNAGYTASFLMELHGETGVWTGAAGACCLQTPGCARRYAARFTEIHAGLRVPTRPALAPSVSERAETTVRPNAYPLSPTGQPPGKLDSFVPSGAKPARAFGMRYPEGQG